MDHEHILRWLIVCLFIGAVAASCAELDEFAGVEIDDTSTLLGVAGLSEIMGVTITSGSSAPTASADLIAWWRIDDATDSGAYITDINATVGGDNFATQAVAGARGTVSGDYISLDGTDDSVYATNLTLLNGSNSFTVCSWIWPDVTPCYDGILCSRGTQLHGTTLWADTTTIKFYANSTVLSGSAPSSLVTNWHHIVGSYDGTNQVLYLDGVQLATAAKSGTITVSDGGGDKNGMWRGGWDTWQTTRRHDGLMDDLRLYDRGLTSNEQHSVYAEGRQ